MPIVWKYIYFKKWYKYIDLDVLLYYNNYRACVDDEIMMYLNSLIVNYLLMIFWMILYLFNGLFIISIYMIEDN